MKSLLPKCCIAILFASTLISLKARAEASEMPAAWRKLIECHQGRTVIDIADGSALRTARFQIVFRDQHVLGEMLQTGAVNTRRLTALNEIVLRLKPRIPEGGWISDDDAFEAGGSVHFAFLKQDGLHFQAYRTSLESNGHYRVLDKLGTWDFRPCTETKNLTEKQ